jgi:WD40 repeat protein
LPNNQFAIGCKNGDIQIWDYNEEKIISSFCALGKESNNENPEILCVYYIGHERIISTAFDRTARIHNYKTSECLGTLQLENSARCAALLDNSQIALGCYDGTIRLSMIHCRQLFWC